MSEGKKVLRRITMQKILSVIFLLILVTGCATQRIPFPEAELAALPFEGDVTVKGRMFLIDQFEEEQVGKVSEITIEPVSAYSNQWYEVRYVNNKYLKNADARYEKYQKKTTADDKGLFSIAGIAPGEYYLSGTLDWAVLNCSLKIVKTPVMISKKIVVKETDQLLEIPLTKEFESPLIICDLYNQGNWEKE